MLARETLVEVARLVSARHVNPLGTLYGGYMLAWVVDVGTIAAMDFAEGDVVLGFLDRMHFVSPVRLGDLLLFRAWVLGVRRSSMSVLAEAYVGREGERRLATVARMIFVKVDGEGRPAPVGRAVRCDGDWEALCLYFARWRQEVDAAVGRQPADRGWPVLSHHLVMPEDSIDGRLMYGARLLALLDQLAFIPAWELRPAVYVTAGVNRMAFRRPIYVGDILRVKAGVTHVGRTSVEVGFYLEAVGPSGRREVADGYFTFVNMSSGRPTPVGEGPRDPEAEARRREAVEEARLLKSLRPRAVREPWLLGLFQ